MKWGGPDSINSWLISLVCCFINTMIFGMARLSGVLFVASIPRYKVAREQASFPYTFASFVKNLSGPLVGYLGHKFGVRAVTAFGALLGAVGAGLCFFAESITAVTFLWGAVFGLGYGLGNILLPVSINQYFDKHRATASGISFSGACLGSFILPPIVEILLKTYGLSQTFLFLSGFILNCVPAALLLRKPYFAIQKKIASDEKQSEKQNIIAGTKGALNTVENSYMPEMLQTRNSDISIYSSDKENLSQNYTALTYEERLKRLSTQTLLSGYSVRMSSSEPLDVDKIMDNSKGRRQVDLKVLQSETFSLSSDITDEERTSEKDDVFDKPTYSSNIRCEEKVASIKFSGDLSNKQIFQSKQNTTLETINSESYQNYGYLSDIDVISKDSSNIYVTDCSKHYVSEKTNNQILNLNSSNRDYQISLITSNERVKNISQNLSEYTKTPKWPGDKSHKEIDKKFQYVETKKASSLGAFSVICDPMFVLIAVTNAIYTSSFVCMVTIIVDFSRDLQIGESNEKYILMLLSVGDIAGRLGLGWITDHGYMSTPAFTSVCFAGQGLFSAAIVWSNDFNSLAILVTLYGLAQAGLIVIFPVIIAKFIEPEKQTVAIPSSHFLSGPLCLAIAPLIGYFRDEIGAYDWIFYVITMLSAASSVSWIFAPRIEKCRRKR